MSDEVPTLTLSGAELWQIAQTVNAFAALAARIRLRNVRERDGRLAYSDATHAEWLHEARRFPPLRRMSDEEQLAWRARIPDAAVTPDGQHPVAVHLAPMLDPEGLETGEWGLEARNGDADMPATGVTLVVRDYADADLLAAHLEQRGDADTLRRLQDLANRAAGRYMTPDQITELTATGMALSEQDWTQALRDVLPGDIADRIIVDDPDHPRHDAWRELWTLANEEVARVGADPLQLAHIIKTGAFWRHPVDDAPSLAHWTITQARELDDYAARVTPPSHSGTEAVTSRSDEDTSRPLALDEVSTPAQAQQWAHTLDPRDPHDRIEAKIGFGRWGPKVDAILDRRFPGLLSDVTAAIRRSRARRAGQPVPAAAGGHEDQQRLSTLRHGSMEPTARRGTALALLEHGQPALDLQVAELMEDDLVIQEVLAGLYPDGLPEAAAWSWRADADEAHAAADAARPDIPTTVRREDADGIDDARADEATAAKEHGLAATAARRFNPGPRTQPRAVPRHR
jgi:hypothetical protein